MKPDQYEHRFWALWAADCAEHVLQVFEENNADMRPREAIEAARAWAREELSMTDARKYAFAAHAAARKAIGDRAVFAARAAGHAAATAHVASHAKHAATYAQKAASNQRSESKWQIMQLPGVIRSLKQA